MEIHKPKPWHGLREFLKEYVIIVVGVLTALAAEAGVEKVHWWNEVRAAKAALAGEIAQNSRVFAYRVAAGPCIARRLDELEDVVERVARRAPVPWLGPVMPDTGDALHDNIWQSHQASQTVTHFDAGDLAAFGAYYQQVGYARLGMNQEGENETTLRILQGDPARLGPADVTALRLAIQRVRFVDTVLVAIARQELETARRLHIAAPAPDGARIAALCQPLRASAPDVSGDR
jgi:hypothetical protein